MGLSGLRAVGAMHVLDYPRHFVLLGCGAIVLSVALLLPRAIVHDRVFFIFGMSAVLHAMAVVLSLRSPSSRLARLGFVVTAVASSLAAPLLAVTVIDLAGLRGIEVILVALALASAIGAVSYWVLMRSFWAPFLSLGSLPVTVASCVVAALIPSLAMSVVPFVRNPVPFPHDVLVPALWWLAFSSSVWLADRYTPDATKSRGA